MEYEKLQQQCLAYAGLTPDAKVDIIEILELMRENRFNTHSPHVCFRLAKYIEELRNKTI